MFSPGLTIFRKERPNRGSGILIAVQDIPCKQLRSPDGLELIAVSLCFAEPIALGKFYFSPNTNTQSQVELIDYLPQVSDTPNYGRF